MTSMILASNRKRVNSPINCAKVAPYRTHGDVERLVQAFESCTLPRSEWTHSAHLIVALWYLTRYDGDEAVMRIRNGINRYNAAVGVHNTRSSGYHETITLFWVWAVCRFLLLEGEGRSVAELAARLVERYADSSLPFAYYSRERLMSWEARASWLEPDLKPYD